MATPGQELANIDFEALIGGVLGSVVRAQAQAALTTADFIKTIGFKPAEVTGVDVGNQQVGEPATVTFRIRKSVPVEGEGGTTLEQREFEVTVPLLSILPIPYLNIDDVTFDFLAKINSVEFRQVDSTVAVGGELEAKAGWGWGSARLKVTASYQRQEKTGNTTTRDYSLKVLVKASAPPLPGGMGRVLDILESLITEEPAAA